MYLGTWPGTLICTCDNRAQTGVMMNLDEDRERYDRDHDRDHDRMSSDYNFAQCYSNVYGSIL